ncbi:MAG: LLM class flavin-dependent oxidoreductase [bacterium]|nr:LLM class flavin-dependent oxidoreductase [bacterium]
MRGFRVGISAMQYEPYPVLVRKWRYFEELGFDSLWHCDHLLFTGDSTVPLYEGWTILSALAAETSRIRLGVLVSSNVLRHPALLAQEAITVDHVSQGRVEVGVGCGWFEEEHERFGIPLFEPGERVDRFSEAMEIIELLLRGETVSYQGEHYQLSEAKLRPYPVQLPRPPLTLAAHQPRMIRICARYADRWNSSGTPEEMAERNRLLDEACDKIGRDPKEILRSMRVSVPKLVAGGFPNPWSSVDAFCEVAGAYREAGVEEFIIDQPRPEQYRTAERIASEVL